MSDFINVPVPSRLVVDVMRFVVSQDPNADISHAGTASRVSATTSGMSDESRDWSREQFQVLRESDAPSVQLFGQVLSILTEASPQPVPLKDISEEIGVEALAMQKSFGAVTRWAKNRWGGDGRWSIIWPGGGWAMNEHNASLWKAIAVKR